MRICAPWSANEYLYLRRVGGDAGDGAADWLYRPGAGVHAMNDNARELDLSRCKQRIHELTGQIEDLQAKLGHQEHYYQMNVARIDELESALRKLVYHEVARAQREKNHFYCIEVQNASLLLGTDIGQSPTDTSRPVQL